MPTRAHAAEVLLETVREQHAECIRLREQWNQGDSSAASSAFSYISEVQRKSSEVQAALGREAEEHQRVRAAKAAVDVAATAELKATAEREAADAALDELKASFRAAKRQKAAASGASASDVEMVADEQAEAELDDNEPWRTWTLQRWRKHEAEIQKRRTTAIDPTNTNKSLPPKGDEARGWRHHRRRGLIGSLQDWAEGSKSRVAFMLAEMATHFGVDQE
eukprot:4198586-Prymnesium_polylepis.1